MRIFFLFVFILTFCLSCKNYGYLNPEGQSNVKEIDLREYKIYQFSMSRKLDFKGQLLVDNNFFESNGDNNDGVVHEIIYLLRDNNSNQIIYFTTFSHKYLYKNGGIFNSPYYKKYVVVNDLDNLFIGIEQENRFSFYDPEGKSYAQNIHLFFTENQSGIITIDSLTNNYAKEKDRKKTSFIKVEEDVFGIPINFREQTEKVFVFEHKSNADLKTGIFSNVTHLYIDEKDVYFKYVNDDEDPCYPFYGEKVRFVEPQ